MGIKKSNSTVNNQKKSNSTVNNQKKSNSTVNNQNTLPTSWFWKLNASHILLIKFVVFSGASLIGSVIAFGFSPWTWAAGFLVVHIAPDHTERILSFLGGVTFSVMALGSVGIAWFILSKFTRFTPVVSNYKEQMNAFTMEDIVGELNVANNADLLYYVPNTIILAFTHDIVFHYARKEVFSYFVGYQAYMGVLAGVCVYFIPTYGALIFYGVKFMGVVPFVLHRMFRAFVLTNKGPPGILSAPDMSMKTWTDDNYPSGAQLMGWLYNAMFYSILGVVVVFWDIPQFYVDHYLMRRNVFFLENLFLGLGLLCALAYRINDTQPNHGVTLHYWNRPTTTVERDLSARLINPIIAKAEYTVTHIGVPLICVSNGVLMLARHGFTRIIPFIVVFFVVSYCVWIYDKHDSTTLEITSVMCAVVLVVVFFFAVHVYARNECLATLRTEQHACAVKRKGLAAMFRISEEKCFEQIARINDACSIERGIIDDDWNAIDPSMIIRIDLFGCV